MHFDGVTPPKTDDVILTANQNTGEYDQRPGRAQKTPFGLDLIGYEDGASILNQSQSEVKLENPMQFRIAFDTSVKFFVRGFSK